MVKRYGSQTSIVDGQVRPVFRYRSDPRCKRWKFDFHLTSTATLTTTYLKHGAKGHTGLPWDWCGVKKNIVAYVHYFLNLPHQIKSGFERLIARLPTCRTDISTVLCDKLRRLEFAHQFSRASTDIVTVNFH